jgi:hypothetical protein
MLTGEVGVCCDVGRSVVQTAEEAGGNPALARNRVLVPPGVSESDLLRWTVSIQASSWCAMRKRPSPELPGDVS